MEPRRWEEIQAAFNELVELDGVERRTRIAALGATDPDLRAAVESLLAADAEADDQLAPIEASLGSPVANQLDRVAAALAERYHVERELGRGGMATVYLAQDLKHDRDVAIKVLNPEVATSVGVERFLREIRLAARLQHPHILPLHDSGEAGGFLFYVMPYVTGETLRRRLEREQQLPLDDALSVTREVAEALDYAHRQGVVHRDIKPENILLAEGQAIVADFGIAHAIAAATDGEKLTATGLAVGTPTYMSPEQASGETQLDGRSDVYSLGCVLYEMLAGEPPYTGPSAQAVFAKRLSEPVPHVRTLREVPEAVEEAVTRALARAPADRFGSATQFAEALAQAEVHGTVPRARLRWLIRRAWPAALRNRVLIAVLGGSVAIVAAGAWLWVQQSRARWARTVALPEATHLLEQGKTYGAFRLLRRAEAYVPDDPVVKELLIESTLPVTVRTTPPDARVYVRDFCDDSNAWEFLGSAPLAGVRLPKGTLVWKVSREGFQTQEVLRFTPVRTFQFSLQPVASAPTDMVPIAGGRFELFSTRPVELDDYWIDKYEVTNRQFKEFLGRGGYEKREYWTEPFVKDGRAVSWDEARQMFRDRTGRPGPATWELGTYPDGRDDYPVAGVSWYEAAAYCESVGKKVPTVYHWYNAADLGGITDFARFGNFQADGPAKVGHPLRLGINGTYDMAGNVKEWVWNLADPSRRYILGAGWNEPSYYFHDYDAQHPFDRSPTYGVRCVKYRAPIPPKLGDAIPTPSRDYRRETPVREGVFAVYKSLYQYDRTPLEARVDSVDDGLEHWRMERVSFAAAYSNERVPALLFLPKNARPPYQTVAYFPGAGAFRQGWSPSAVDDEGYWFLFLVRSGRAVLLPIYKGSYERNFGPLFELPHVWRDVMIHASKDLGRAIDYLETRPDINVGKLAYLGVSMGAGVGPIMTAVEPRFKASILLGGGLYVWRRPPESDAFNFLPRVSVPTLMINGRHDFYFPFETSQAPMFRLLGAPAAEKRHRVFESGHVPTERQEVMKEILDWLDRYLGPAR